MLRNERKTRFRVKFGVKLRSSQWESSMSKTIYRSVKRRTVRPKAAKKAAEPFNGMLARLNAASAALSAARGRR